MNGFKRLLKEHRDRQNTTVKQRVQESRKGKVNNRSTSTFAESFKTRAFREEKTVYGEYYNLFIDKFISLLQSTKQNEKSGDTASDLMSLIDGKQKGSFTNILAEFANLLEDWEDPKIRPSAEKGMKALINRL